MQRQDLTPLLRAQSRRRSVFDLRAGRRTGGGGRIYSVTCSAVDAAGNTTTATRYVWVPHDRGGLVAPVSIAVDASAAGTVISWDTVPDARFYRVVARVGAGEFDIVQGSGAYWAGLERPPRVIPCGAAIPKPAQAAGAEG